jgi:hypothetical protein
LTSRREKAVPFLHDRLRQAAASGAFDDDPKRLARLIADLGRDDFVMREKAAKELAKLGQRAAPALQKALENPAGLEVKRRIEILLKDAAAPTLSSEWLRAERALEALEQIGTYEVRQALEGLGKEAQNRHWLKARVTESLRRLGK